MAKFRNKPVASERGTIYAVLRQIPKQENLPSHYDSVRKQYRKVSATGFNQAKKQLFQLKALRAKWLETWEMPIPSLANVKQDTDCIQYFHVYSIRLGDKSVEQMKEHLRNFGIYEVYTNRYNGSVSFVHRFGYSNPETNAAPTKLPKRCYSSAVARMQYRPIELRDKREKPKMDFFSFVYRDANGVPLPIPDDIDLMTALEIVSQQKLGQSLPEDWLKPDVRPQWEKWVEKFYANFMDMHAMIAISHIEQGIDIETWEYVLDRIYLYIARIGNPHAENKDDRLPQNAFVREKETEIMIPAENTFVSDTTEYRFNVSIANVSKVKGKIITGKRIEDLPVEMQRYYLASE